MLIGRITYGVTQWLLFYTPNCQKCSCYVYIICRHCMSEYICTYLEFNPMAEKRQGPTISM